MIRSKSVLFRCLFHFVPYTFRSPSILTLRPFSSILSGSHPDDYTTQYGRIPVEKLEIKYSKSSAPGGQHVNKNKTKVQIRLKIAKADWLPEEVKQAILAKYKNKFTKDGVLLLESQSSRYQILNERDTMLKLQAIIENAIVKPGVTPEAKLLKISEQRSHAKEEMKLLKQARKSRKADRFGYD